MARVTVADFADSTVMGGSQFQWPHPRVHLEVHRYLWLLNPSTLPIAATIADGEGQSQVRIRACRNHQIAALAWPASLVCPAGIC
jgi:hypothetical protein